MFFRNYLVSFSCFGLVRWKVAAVFLAIGLGGGAVTVCIVPLILIFSANCCPCCDVQTYERILQQLPSLLLGFSIISLIGLLSFGAGFGALRDDGAGETIADAPCKICGNGTKACK